MRICYVTGYYEPGTSSGQEVVANTVTLREFPQAMAALEHAVHVVHHYHQDEQFLHNGVTYHFVHPRRDLAALGRLAGRLLGGWPYPYYQLDTRLLSAIRLVEPDVIHFFGLTMDLNLALVARYIAALDVPLVIHYHGGKPATHPLRHLLQRHNMQRAAKLLFSTRKHAQPWVDAGLATEAQIEILMETSSTFRPQPRPQAREMTGMRGDPVFLWAGRLHPDKDPWTALQGFARIAGSWPHAQLYLHYLTDELLPELQTWIEDQPGLAERVHFRGRVRFHQMEAIYNSADFILQASRREHSGCAILEAMACGVIPVVTDIPSFRAMTHGGGYGVLYPVGDADALARGVLAIPRDEIAAQSAAVSDWFQRALSFPALARRLDAIYRSVVTGEG
jgi:glycosyltransferase involved in cell wall biosynthesis